jgi:hypothetical protein
MTANSATAGTIANVGRNAWYMTIDGTATGYTSLPLSFLSEIATSDVQFGQDSSPIYRRVDAQTYSLELSLNELTNDNFLIYLGGLATESGGTISCGDKKGETVTTYSVCLYPLHQDGHPLSGRVFTFHKCSIVPNGPLALDPSSNEFEELPIKIFVHKDTTQSAGSEFFTYAAAVTTAPTVSSVTPTDETAAAAVDVAVTITFSQAMGASATVPGNYIIAKSDWSAFVAPSAVTLNTARTVATLTHANFANSTAYVVYLTKNIRNSVGVPIAANYAWNFTTVGA